MNGLKYIDYHSMEKVPRLARRTGMLDFINLDYINYQGTETGGRFRYGIQVINF